MSIDFLLHDNKVSFSDIGRLEVFGVREHIAEDTSEGLDAAGAVAVADALQTAFDAGRTAAYAALVHPEDTSQYGPDVLFEPPPGSPHPFVEKVATFAAFLRESGGFVIW